jgi:putative hydrolase of the HAD superfamily
MTARFAMKPPLNIFSCPLNQSMKELPYKVILLDLFHTLVDVGTAPGASGRYTADILGLSREAWNRACFGAAHDICRPTSQLAVIRALAHSLDPAIPEARIREAAEERQRRFDHALLSVEPQVLDCLAELNAMGLRLGLLSNASTDEVRAWEDSPLAAHFEQAFFSWECGCAKPQPAFYRHALARMGVGTDECLFVGDGGSEEHSGAREVGIDNVLLTRHIGHFDEARLAPRRAAVKWEIASLQALRPLLQGMGEKKKGA